MIDIRLSLEKLDELRVEWEKVIELHSDIKVELFNFENVDNFIRSQNSEEKKEAFVSLQRKAEKIMKEFELTSTGKNKSQLRTEVRKLMLKFHPDKLGSKATDESKEKQKELEELLDLLNEDNVFPEKENLYVYLRGLV